MGATDASRSTESEAGSVVLDVEDIPIGEGRVVVLDEEQVAVFRLRSSGEQGEQFRAVSAVCPHLGGPLADGQIDNGKVVCPLHLHAYDLADGHSLTGQPALKVYSVVICDGKVKVAAAS